MKCTNSSLAAVFTYGCFTVAAFTFGCGQASPVVIDDVETGEVSVGYGTRPRENVTASISAIDAEKESKRISRVEEMLEGTAGVRILRSLHGGIRVQIRGTGSIFSGTEPLYVVDGIPVQLRAGQGLDWLNPADVDTIVVLKDASSTAIYGSRGANGVVIIETKRQ
jgi:TonB-dependent SusC/RagA subfamily outer membrane receptor